MITSGRISVSTTMKVDMIQVTIPRGRANCSSTENPPKGATGGDERSPYIRVLPNTADWPIIMKTTFTCLIHYGLRGQHSTAMGTTLSAGWALARQSKWSSPFSRNFFVCARASCAIDRQLSGAVCPPPPPGTSLHAARANWALACQSRYVSVSQSGTHSSPADLARVSACAQQF